MLNGEQQMFTARRVRVLQIIVLAMVAGIVCFLTIILTVPGLARPLAAERQGQIVTYVAAGYGGLALVAAPFMSAGVVSVGRRRIARPLSATPQKAPIRSSPTALQGEASSLVVVYFTKTILSAAIYEGSALFLCIAYMLGRKPVALVVAAILLLALLWQVPTSGRARRWLTKQLQQIEERRSMQA